MVAFSVVLPVRDREEQVSHAVRSVVHQTLADWELIVVDDGSRDGTSAAVAAVGDARVRLVRQDHLGVSAARNRGAQEARGRWITFLDSDDEALPKWLATFRSLLHSEKADLACLGARVVPPGGGRATVVRPRALGPAYDDGVGLFLAGTFALSRELFLELGGYESCLTLSENTELALRLLPAFRQRGLAIAVCDEIQLVYQRAPRPRRPDAAQARTRLQSALFLLQRHGERLARDPRLYASYWAIAGVAACRVGDLQDARRYFAQAVRIRPSDPLHLARYLLSFAPLAYLAWPQASPSSIPEEERSS